MGFVTKTTAGTYRANWRDAGGRQKAKTFKTKKEANAFLATTEASLNSGSYVDPHAGRMRFGEYADKWMAARNNEITTAARDLSLMRTHLRPKWGTTPLARIDHLAAQQWVTDLGRRLAPASVAKCHQLMAALMRSAVRDRLIGANPCDGVRLPRRRTKDTEGQTITPAEVAERLLPAVPDRHRALVALAAGTGLRWGECVGLRWDAVDLVKREVHVIRVAIEVAGAVSAKPFPKSKAGRRTVPLPPLAVARLRHHRDTYEPGPAGEVFTNQAGGPPRRTLFRARVWRPALAEAGLLGNIEQVAPGKFRASWPDPNGMEQTAETPSRAEAVALVATNAAGGLRFHDLRHSYATWLISSGVPVNDVQKVMGHEQASTTLNRYTHHSGEHDSRVRSAFADFSLTPQLMDNSQNGESPSEEGL